MSLSFGNHRRRPITGATSGLLFLVACASGAGGPTRISLPSACDRVCLKAHADRYIEALAARDPSRLSVTGDVRFTENGRTQLLGRGLWRTAGSPGNYREYVVDPERRGVAIQTILEEGSSQVQLLVRLRLDNRQRISEIEMLTAREGDTCCWDPAKLEGLSRAFRQPLSPDERLAREQLVALAEAYFEALHTAGTSQYRRTVVATTMERYENGKQTTNVTGGNRVIRRDAQTQLDSAMFGRISVVGRRYPVVDVAHGTVLGIVVFEYPESTRPSEIIAEFFKMERGTIQEIRAVMVKQTSTGWP